MLLRNGLASDMVQSFKKRFEDCCFRDQLIVGALLAVDERRPVFNGSTSAVIRFHSMEWVLFPYRAQIYTETIQCGSSDVRTVN